LVCHRFLMSLSNRHLTRSLQDNHLLLNLLPESDPSETHGCRQSRVRVPP
jgi:hypothetical protein